MLKYFLRSQTLIIPKSITIEVDIAIFESVTNLSIHNNWHFPIVKFFKLSDEGDICKGMLLLKSICLRK